MKEYLIKRIEGLAVGVTGLKKVIAEVEQLQASRRSQLTATQGALEEAQDTLAEYNRVMAAVVPPTDGPKET